MNQIEREVYVLDNKTKNPIDYVQGTNAVPFVFYFRDYDIPYDAVAAVYVQKPSGLAVYNLADISDADNSVTVDVTTQMFAEVGCNTLQIQISRGEDELVTFDQPVRVYKSFADVPESQNESSLLNDILDAIEEASEIAEKAEAGDFSATVRVGTVTTGDPGSQAAVTNSGTSKDAVFDFTIPQGIRGPQGLQGPQGIQGLKGDKGEKGDPGESGVTTPISGFINFSVDPTGDLYVYYADENVPISFYYDEATGELYYETEE